MAGTIPQHQLSPTAPLAAGPFADPRRMATFRRQLGGPRVRKNLFGALCFALLLTICLPGLNAFINQALGFQQAFSVLILVLCLAILAVYKCTLKRDLGRSGWLFMGFMAVYLIIGGLIAVRGSVGGLLNLGYSLRLTLSSVLVVAASAVATRHIVLGYSIKTLLHSLFLITLLIPASVVFGYYFPQFFEFRVGDNARHTGFFGGPNEAGFAICLVAVVGFGCLVFTKRKVFVMTGIAFAGAMTVATVSRSAILIFLGLIALQIVISSVLKNKSILLIGGAIALGVVAFIIREAQVGDFETRGEETRITTLDGIFRGNINDETTGGRFGIAANVVRYWGTSPFVGHGLGNHFAPGFRLGSHNTYIRVGCESGIVAFFMLLLFMFVFAREAYKCKIPVIRTLTLSFAALFAAACLVSHTELLHRQQNVMLGICFGLLVAAKELKPMSGRRPRRRVKRMVPGGRPPVGLPNRSLGNGDARPPLATPPQSMPTANSPKPATSS